MAGLFQAEQDGKPPRPPRPRGAVKVARHAVGTSPREIADRMVLGELSPASLVLRRMDGGELMRLEVASDLMAGRRDAARAALAAACEASSRGLLELLEGAANGLLSARTVLYASVKIAQMSKDEKAERVFRERLTYLDEVHGAIVGALGAWGVDVEE
jgi:hypothetical protein